MARYGTVPMVYCSCIFWNRDWRDSEFLHHDELKSSNVPYRTYVHIYRTVKSEVEVDFGKKNCFRREL